MKLLSLSQSALNSRVKINDIPSGQWELTKNDIKSHYPKDINA